jgi:hypothetical protein
VVSLVSVAARSRCYLCGTIERVAECETVEVANIHAAFMHVAEKMAGYGKRLGEYPTLSASLAMRHHRFPAHTRVLTNSLCTAYDFA